ASAPERYAPVVATAAPIAVPVTAAAPVAAAQRTRRDSACRADGISGNFSGYTNTDARGTILERVGSGGGVRIVQRHFGDLLVCMVSDEVDGADRPSEWPGRAGRVVLETERDGSSERLEVVEQAGGVEQAWR